MPARHLEHDAVFVVDAGALREDEQRRRVLGLDMPSSCAATRSPGPSPVIRMLLWSVVPHQQVGRCRRNTQLPTTAAIFCPRGDVCEHRDSVSKIAER